MIVDPSVLGDNLKVAPRRRVVGLPVQLRYWGVVASLAASSISSAVTWRGP